MSCLATQSQNEVRCDQQGLILKLTVMAITFHSISDLHGPLSICMFTSLHAIDILNSCCCFASTHTTPPVLFPSWTQFLYFISHFVLHCKQQKIPVIASCVSVSIFDGWLRSKGNCGLACIEVVEFFRDICSDSSLKARWKLRLPVSS